MFPSNKYRILLFHMNLSALDSGVLFVHAQRFHHLLTSHYQIPPIEQSQCVEHSSVHQRMNGNGNLLWINRQSY